MEECNVLQEETKNIGKETRFIVLSQDEIAQMMKKAAREGAIEGIAG